jgi:hypothetical protein
MINDVYTLDNYPHFASAVKESKALESVLDCKVVSTLNGDFMGPCVLTSLDGGRAMIQGLNHANVDFLCIGNHELDLGYQGLVDRMSELDSTTTCVNSNLGGLQGKKIGDRLGPSFATLKVRALLLLIVHPCICICDMATIILSFMSDRFPVDPPINVRHVFLCRLLGVL